jgi:hypothetical protein
MQNFNRLHRIAKRNTNRPNRCIAVAIALAGLNVANMALLFML